MSRPGNFDHMIGIDFSLSQSSLSHCGVVRLDDLLSEHYHTFPLSERDDEGAPPFAVLKFACHNSENPTQQGFIRMYVQIPYENTLRSSQEVRGLQAEPSPVHDEYEALTSLSKSKSTAVPELLGYGQGKQGPEGYVPNGYITYIAWARVPGAPVDYQVFWKEGNRQYRDEVRAAFAVAYKELNKFPWQPGVRSPRKLIYDHVSQTIHFAGFRPAFKKTDNPMSVPTYALWGLLKFAVTRDGRVDRTAWAW